MYKFLVGLVVVFTVSVISAQSYYPNFAYPQGYIMQEGAQAQQQGIQQIANWWGSIRGKASDTGTQTLTTSRWGADSLACYMVANWSNNVKLLKYICDNNRKDTGYISIPANGNTPKLPKLWKIVNVGGTMDSLTLFFQNIKKLPDSF